MKTDNYVHYDTARLNALPITQVVSRFESLKRAGSVYKSLCPWHEDTHPSLTLYERTNENRCHCFACGKGGSVIDYVMAARNVDFKEACQWLSHEFGILVSNEKSYVPLPLLKLKKKTTNEPTPDYIPVELLDQLVSVENSLCQCLMRLFQPEAVEWVAEEYRIGCYSMNGRDDYTIFPSIDANGRVCNLKVQCYETDPQSPRYTHCLENSCYWLATMWQREQRLPAEGNFTAKCLFGEHLLSQYPSQTIALVESPKNAIVGALEQPQFLWIAAGNKYMLERKYLEALRGRDVIVIPDRDAISAWTVKLKGMNDIANFIISHFCEQVAPADEPKYDIADYIIYCHQTGSFGDL